MDDLISRKAAIGAFTGKPPEYYHTSYIVGELNCLPAVNAIPVEWLEWRVMNAKYNGIKEAADAFDFVLNCWKEQEAQDE